MQDRYSKRGISEIKVKGRGEREIVTCEEVYNKTKNKKDFFKQKIVLKCQSCGKSDILAKFIDNREGYGFGEKEFPLTTFYASQTGSIKLGVFFQCPGCAGSVISYDDDYKKLHMLYFLKDKDGKE